MKSLWKSLSIVAAILLMSAVFSPTTRAADWNRKIQFTISQPMEIPGNIILPAGDYTLKRLDLPVDEHIVQFFSGDEKKIYNTVFTVPEYRLDPAKETTLTFYEHSAGTVPAVRSMLVEGSTVGLQFVYPRARAEQLAMATSANSESIAVAENTEPESSLDPVTDSQSDNGSSQWDNGSAPQSVAAAAPSQSDLESTPPDMDADASPADGPDGGSDQGVTPDQSATPAPVATSSSDDSATQPPALPKTAGAQDLLLLIGMGSTAGAFALRKFRR